MATINIQVRSEPIDVAFGTTLVEFVPEIDAASLVGISRVMSTLADARNGDGTVDPERLEEVLRSTLDLLATLTVDDDNAQTFRGLRLPVGALTTLVRGLVEEWTGRPTVPSPDSSEPSAPVPTDG